MKTLYLALFSLLTVTLLSCGKMEGYGGKASISGKVYGRDYTPNGNLSSEDYIGDVRVYISKHGSTQYFDDIRTSYDGSYQFDYLQVGKYDLWAFGDCDNCDWDQMFDLITIEITAKKEVVVAPDIEITF
jgi:hypothetical protein